MKRIRPRVEVAILHRERQQAEEHAATQPPRLGLQSRLFRERPCGVVDQPTLPIADRGGGLLAYVTREILEACSHLSRDIMAQLEILAAVDI